MDSCDKRQDEDNISPIMKLPEEAMREVFNNMSFQTLYFSLRRACKNIQSYVDNYLKVRAIPFFISFQNVSEQDVIEVNKMPKNGLIILRTPATSVPWVTSILRNNEILKEDLFRLIDMSLHPAMFETGV